MVDVLSLCGGGHPVIGLHPSQPLMLSRFRWLRLRLRLGLGLRLGLRLGIGLRSGFALPLGRAKSFFAAVSSRSFCCLCGRFGVVGVQAAIERCLGLVACGG